MARAKSGASGPERAIVGEQRWTAEDGRRAVAAWRSSGLSLREFSRRHGLNVQRVAWWKRRLEQRGDRSDDRAPVRLVPVVTRNAEHRGNVVVLVMRVDDVVVEVHEPELVPPAWLSALMTALSGTPRS